MKRKKRRIIKKIIRWLLLLMTIVGLVLVLFFSVRWVIQKIQTPTILQEDESMHISPPSNEDILYRAPDGTIHLYQTGLKQDLSLTKGPDFAPSWDKEGDGFHFIRKIDDQAYTIYYYSLSDQIEKLVSTQEVYSAYDLPDPENTWIRFSPDGKKIILSSQELGLQVIDRENVNPDTFRKRKTVSLSEIWQDLGIVSRNDKFCLLTTHRKKDISFITGIASKIPIVNQLFLIQTDLRNPVLIDQSDSPFFGFSFSHNGYTFSYSKNGQIFYVDSIQKIQPIIVANGSFPTIKPSQRYHATLPKWIRFDLLNACLIQPLSSPFESSVLLANHQSLAIYHVDKQQLKIVPDHRNKNNPVLGYQLVDLLLEDLTGDGLPELFCSWQSHDQAFSAERLSQFSLSGKGILKEIFRSEKKYRNSWKLEDLNQDGVLEVLHLYVDWEGEEVTMLENVTWVDIYQIQPHKWELHNTLYPTFYSQLNQKYKDFLSNAIKKPSRYGKLINILERWINQSENLSNNQG